MSYIDPKYLKYATDVITGQQVAGQLIKYACQRYLDWFNRPDMIFLPDKADRVVTFLSHLKHFQGKHSGKNFILEPWQEWIVYAIFGFYWLKDDTRVIRNAYMEVARKNGKSFLWAGISLYMCIADGEANAECDFLASNFKQAGIAFKMAKTLAEGIDPKGKQFKYYRDNIIFRKDKSIVQVFSSEASGLDGFNSSFWICDELHAHPNGDLWNVMSSSAAMRAQPLGVACTTAGFDKSSFCYDFRQNCVEVISGLKKQDSLFAAIFSLDSTDHWDDENVWIKANPNLGVTVSPDFIRDEVEKARNNSSLVVGVKTKTLNMWCDSADNWIPDDIVVKSMKVLDIHEFKDRICYVGIDLSAVSDLTAVTYMFPPTPEDPHYYFFNDIYLPQDTIQSSVNQLKYEKWVREGFIKVTPGNVTDYDYILKDILEINQNVLIQKIAYDQWQSTFMIIKATEQGLPCDPFSQSLGSFNRPTKEFERLILSNSIVVQYNPVVRWNFANTTIKNDWNQNSKPVKSGKEANKIDTIISMLQSLGKYIESPIYDFSI